MLGRASANHHPRPFKKPLPFADTKSRTIRPSSLATITLSTVRITRNTVCSARRNASFPVFLSSALLNGTHVGKAILKTAKSMRQKRLLTPSFSPGASGVNSARCSAYVLGLIGVNLTLDTRPRCGTSSVLEPVTSGMNCCQLVHPGRTRSTIFFSRAGVFRGVSLSLACLSNTLWRRSARYDLSVIASRKAATLSADADRARTNETRAMARACLRCATSLAGSLVCAVEAMVL